MEKNLRKSPARLAAQSENKMRKSRSPGRPKSPSRASGKPTKSPSRNKSPSRKSPGRKAVEKSPKKVSDKSPSRKKNVRSKLDLVQRVSIEKLTPAILENQSNLVAEGIAELRKSRERSRTVDEVRVISQTSTMSPLGDYNADSDGSILRRSSRIKTSRDYDGNIRKEIDEQVDKIIKANHITVPDITLKSNHAEFGGWLGASFLILFVPFFIFAIQFTCLKEKCKPLDFIIPKNWRYYLDPLAASWYVGFVTLQFLLSILPLARKVNGIPSKSTTLQYRCSGIVNAVLSLSVVATLQYFKYPVVAVVSKTISLLVSSLIFGLLLSLILFIKGGRPGVSRNPYGNTGNKIYDFWIGREINPRIGMLDIKQTLLRIAVVGALIYDTAIILRATENKDVANYPVTLLVIAGLQVFAFVDFLFFEESYLSSFVVQHEGTGYMFVIGSLLWPFFVTFIPKFILLHSLQLNVYCLIALAAIYLMGYIAYRVSSNQKSNFRKNPHNPALSHLESIPTAGGKKILSGGWWGLVRHPNYFGLIFMYWTLAGVVGITHWSPYAIAVTATIILVHRAVRDSARCKAAYGSSWDRYAQKVKYYLVPKVF